MAEHPRDNQEQIEDQEQPQTRFLPPFGNPFDPNIINNFLAEWQKSREIKNKYLEQKTLFYIKENELLQYEIDQLNEEDGPVFIDHGEEKN